MTEKKNFKTEGQNFLKNKNLKATKVPVMSSDENFSKMSKDDLLKRQKQIKESINDNIPFSEGYKLTGQLKEIDKALNKIKQKEENQNE